MDLNLDNYRWDIYPLGFLKTQPDRVAVQAIAYTGEVPVFLGTWSIDSKGEQSRVVSFEKNVEPLISSNGYKVIQDGLLEYDEVEKEEKSQKQQDKIRKKQHEQYKKDRLREIDYEYKYAVKHLDKDYRMEYRDYRKLRALSGVKDSEKLKEAYRKFLIEQYTKDIAKSEKDIDKHNKQLDKINEKLEKLYEKIENANQYAPSKESTLYDFLNNEKQGKTNSLDGFDIENFNYDYNYNVNTIPEGLLDYSDNSGKSLKLRPANTNEESPANSNKDDDAEIDITIYD